MKKVLLGACAIITSANANMNDYTGFFGGLGVTFSVDKDKADLEFGPEMGSNGPNDSGEDDFAPHDPVYSKKHKTAFGGEIVIGYGHQFANNFYVGIMHESLFSTKAASAHTINLATGEGSNDIKAGNEGGFRGDSQGELTYTRSRRSFWTPSFGIAVGYVIDGLNFGIRSGIALEKNKINQSGNAKIGMGVDDDPKSITNKSVSISSNSPYVGAYIECKVENLRWYLNVDHIFEKEKLAKLGVSGATIDLKHKRSSWKAATGVKFNLK